MKTLKKQIQDFKNYNGTTTISSLNELMHNFTDQNDEMAKLVNIRNDYENATTKEQKEDIIKVLFDVMDNIKADSNI